MMQKDLKELLLAFNEQGVEYLVVGGYAVGVHSEPRATKDLHIFIRADVRIGIPPLRIDILQSIDGVAFDDAWNDRIEGLVDGEITAHIISKEHLIQNKLALGRTRDLPDVEAIRDANPEADAE